MVFILVFAVSGIILNHREGLSAIDVSRNFLPEPYRYKNWNNAGVISSLKLSGDSVLVYGNIGVWLTDSAFQDFKDYNSGFAKGIDNRKVAKLLKSSTGDIFAATYFGLFKNIKHRWQKIELPVAENRVVDLMEKDGEIYVMTRSFLLKGKSVENLNLIKMPPPQNYDNKIGLFKTLWVIHSGEIYGFIGKLIVDLIAVIFIFLTITGFIFFINKYRIRSKSKKGLDSTKVKSSSAWNLKWHNKIGWTTVIFLIITTFTGIFLRPPLLAAIGNSRVKKIPLTELDTPNPWFDIFRRVDYDAENGIFVVATMDGFFYSDDNFATELKPFGSQPPASVMGVTVLENYSTNTYLVGSFEGLFLWNYASGMVFDYIKKQPYQRPTSAGAPIGDFKVSGFSRDFMGQELVFDYDLGCLNLSSPTLPPAMPDEIVSASPMSLWNVALEFHTGRIFQPLVGSFYVLVVPLVGLGTLFILISGTVVWWKKFRR